MANYNQALVTTSYTKNLKYNFTANSIIDKARGYWPGILERLGINPSFLKNKHGPCPICGGKDRFRFDNKENKGMFFCNHCGAGDGIKLLMLYHGWDFKMALNMVTESIGEQPQVNVTKFFKEVNTANEADIQKRRDLLKATWIQSKSVMIGDPVDRYLRGRGIRVDCFPKVLKFHPHLSYYHNGSFVGKFPAMLALVQDKDNKVVTLHRTYLGNGCKADVLMPKKLMSTTTPGASSGAAIKLYEPINSQIILAEGIETALSLYVATQIPVWATISANGLETIVLPSSIRDIIIAVDNDVSGRGQNAANKLAKRLLAENRTVKRIMPPKIGHDFNDVLLEENHESQ